ncbi:hypothetical protein [Virgibacillus pantothenticus]|uniref:Uncharacterized protein n=1 Tax=Virgibacillus pantothenticus TaxID=1473 RepID=A0A0L0QTR1_VIRPA|nr:hypothetical protein [Virgibacillus pantothenticus]KNE22040.1 hypothetical protein AFK71_04355 [Virgibacillus pantothenticus]MED3739299.1 hypothetical protein [Virgibacillus pantothenticus]QTY18681.1 hypothetical protein KBP50_05240 [Virgibacillus pantothenticus]SIS94024.1 hypothetical protein SAMN05421787_107131 [Virgibacillus pantothenticus]
MSERKKQVIHVKDLVIKADNVFIEPQRAPRPPHRRDPFFSSRPIDKDENEEYEQEESFENEDLKEDDDEHREDERRSPFSWF